MKLRRFSLNELFSRFFTLKPPYSTHHNLTMKNNLFSHEKNKGKTKCDIKWKTFFYGTKENDKLRTLNFNNFYRNNSCFFMIS